MVSISTKDKWKAITEDLYDRIREGTSVDFYEEAKYDTDFFGAFVAWTQREKKSEEYRSRTDIVADLSSIIERPDKYQDFHIIYMLKRDLELEGPISDVIDEVYKMFQPDRPKEEIEWEKREPEFDDDWEKKGQEYGGKKWDKWYEEGQDEGFDL